MRASIRPGTGHTGADLLTDRQHQRLTALSGVDAHVQVEATWGIYQRVIGVPATPTGPEADSR